jgi:hypothetical protein
MLATHRPGPEATSQPFRFTADYVTTAFHSRYVTHLDSLSRCSWNGKLYNGHTAASVSESGAAIEDIGVARADIVTRGILIDVPFLRGYSADGGGIGLADLGRAEAACGIRPEERDLLLLRACPSRRRLGPLSELLALLHESRIAIFGSNTGNEANALRL